MKVLVATRDGEGEVAGDFCFTVDGELVTPGMLECSSPDTCGCGRSFSGLASSRGTTTARVVDLPEMTREDVRLALAESLRRGGWFSHIDERSADAMTEAQLAAIEAAVSHFEVGTLLGRNGDRLWDRAYPDAL
jgi:hypothetical protein